MRLLDTETGQFVEKDPTCTKYAIFSHTWDHSKGEQTYKPFVKIQKRYTSAGRHGMGVSPAIGPPSGSRPSPKPSRSATAVAAPVPGIHHQGSRLVQLQQLTGQLAGWCVYWFLSFFPRCFFSFVPQRFLSFVPQRFLEPTPSSSHHADPFPAQPELPPAHAGTQASPNAPASDSSSSDPPKRSARGRSKTPSLSIWDDPDLSPKIRQACAVALSNGFRYIWIDLCCIDKSSSAETSEAINSMYEWYKQAEVCYAYLADVPADEDHRKKGSRFRKSQWFTRVWTLQELVAPHRVEFLSADWAMIGPHYMLADLIQEITGISEEALLHVKPFYRFSVAQRLSWASGRQATRLEDQAYALLGILNIKMLPLYGEGDHAFQRLQEHIMQRLPDQTLFAWGQVDLGPPIFTAPQMAQPRTFKLYPYLQEFSLLPTSADSFAYCKDHGGHNPRTQKAGTGMSPFSDANMRSPGHLLGRICCIPPSDSGVDFVHPACLLVKEDTATFDLIPLSPETVEHHRQDIQVKTVYISHLYPHHREPSHVTSSLGPRQTIDLVLQRKTHDALRAQGYTVDFRGPTKTQRSPTHWLGLSDSKHKITVEFQHILGGDGEQFTINAQVAISVLDSAADKSLQPEADASSATMSWTDSLPWKAHLKHQEVRLNARGVDSETLTLRLGFNFICAKAYVLHVLLSPSDAQPASHDYELHDRDSEETVVASLSDRRDHSKFLVAVTLSPSPSSPSPIELPLEEERRVPSASVASGDMPRDTAPELEEVDGDLRGVELTGDDSHPGGVEAEDGAGQPGETDGGREAGSARAEAEDQEAGEDGVST